MRRLAVLAAPTCRTGPGRSGCRSRSRRPLAYREVLSFPELQGLWQRAGASYGIPWQVLASINLIEPNFGQNMGPTSYLQVWDDGLAKVAASVMTVEEVGRVLP